MYKACLWQQTGQCSDYLVSLITCRQEEASQNTLRAYSPNYACMSPCMKDLVWMVSFHGLIQHHEGLEVFSAGCTRCTSPRNTPETPRIIRLSNLLPCCCLGLLLRQHLFTATSLWNDDHQLSDRETGAKVSRDAWRGRFYGNQVILDWYCCDAVSWCPNYPQ